MTTESSRSHLETAGVFVEISASTLEISEHIARVRSPKAGAIVFFLGTTRDSFEDKSVTTLAYSAYVSLALQTLLKIGRDVHEKHSLVGVSIAHRVGDVPVGQDSIIIAASAPHRAAAWAGGEEALELCKQKAEIWKLEEFGDGAEGAWRANEDNKHET